MFWKQSLISSGTLSQWRSLVGNAAHQKLVEVAEKLEDLELLVLARERERALIHGRDRLIPLEEVMRAYGLTLAAPSEGKG